MKHMKFRKLLGIVIIIGIMFGINIFSSQTATESHKLSTELTQKIVMKLGILSEEEAGNAYHPTVRKADDIIRKIAHFCIYFALAFVLYMVIYFSVKKSGYAFFLAWIIATIYAIFDEYYQTFIDGRGAELSDVFIDSLGAMTAVLISVLCVSAICRRKYS